MAQFVETSISIDGKNIKQFSSLSISQGIFNHHSFRLVCPAEAIDGTSGAIFNTSKNMIGGTINAKIDAIGGKGTCQFTGVVTQVEASRHSGHTGDLIISGYSPTILMANGPHCKSWEKKAVKNIAQDILRHFPQNLLQPKIAPTNGETLSYTVQYKETAWQFLSRLSAMYGEWLYYDGQKLVLGPPQGSKVKLIYGSNLNYFNMALEVRPASFEVMGYDYINTEVYDGAPSGIAAKAGLNELGKHTLQKSEKFYTLKPKQWQNQFLTNKKQLDDFVTTRASMQSSEMVRFNGNSGHPGVQVGGVVSVDGKNVFSQADESFGDYTVISIDHHCDGQGNYSNDFMAIPTGVKMPPVSSYQEPDCETQSALVTDNFDPKGLGRIRVRFHWMDESEKSPWLRVTSPHGGNGKGMFFIPEVGEEVIVAFEGNNPVKPFILGMVYNGKAKTDFSNSGNDVKALQTRSGNKVVMNDKEGSILVQDKNGNNIRLDGEGNITVQSGASIVLTCGDTKLEMKSDKSGASITMTCGESKLEMKKDGTVEIDGSSITVNAGQQAKMVSGAAAFTADGQGNEAKMEGLKATIDGTTETKVSGGAKTEIGSTGNVAVKAPLITLN